MARSTTVGRGLLPRTTTTGGVRGVAPGGPAAGRSGVATGDGPSGACSPAHLRPAGLGRHICGRRVRRRRVCSRRLVQASRWRSQRGNRGGLRLGGRGLGRRRNRWWRSQRGRHGHNRETFTLGRHPGPRPERLAAAPAHWPGQPDPRDPGPGRAQTRPARAQLVLGPGDPRLWRPPPGPEHPLPGLGHPEPGRDGRGRGAGTAGGVADATAVTSSAWTSWLRAGPPAWARASSTGPAHPRLAWRQAVAPRRQ